MSIKYKQIQDVFWLTKKVNNQPLRQIAQEVGCSYSAVTYQIRKFNIKVPIRYTRRSSPNKGENFRKTYYKKWPNGRLGRLSSNWKGGRRIVNGYIAIYKPEHPRATNSKRVFEHILVAEKKIGRYLKKNEIVHHINHNKQDNRPENLQVVKRGKHVHNHFKEPIGLRKRVEYLEELLKKHNIAFV